MADIPFKTVDRDNNPVALPTAQAVVDAVTALQGALVPLLDNVETLLAGTPLPTGAATDAKLEAVRVLLAAVLAVDTVVRATSTSRSGTITTGGAAQQLMAANATRRGFAIQNNSAGPLYVNGLGAATADGQSLKIPADALYETATHHVGTGAISILGATTGQAFYAREF